MVVLRKRKQPEPSHVDVCLEHLRSGAEVDGLQRMLDAAASASSLLIFTGSGLSATSGMSTFSTKGGLYERAQKRFGVTDGKKLFTYSFFEKQRLEAMAFYADIYAEAKRAKPSAGHRALAAIAAMGKMQRHYTMNIDGLAESVGLTTWHPDTNPSGQTLEMHGNIHELVCPECGAVSEVTPQHVRTIRAKRALRCGQCGDADLRCRVMLYDDGEAAVITPEDVFDVLEDDVAAADMILWVGISFQQSASTAYFRRVRHCLQDAGRLQKCKQVVVNLSEDCLWNLLSALSNTDDLQVIEVLASSDEALPKLAARLAQTPAAARQPPLETLPPPPEPRASPSPSPKESPAQQAHCAADAAVKFKSSPDSLPALLPAQPPQTASGSRPADGAQPSGQQREPFPEVKFPVRPSVSQQDHEQQLASEAAEVEALGQGMESKRARSEPPYAMHDFIHARPGFFASARRAAERAGARTGNGSCTEADDEATQNVPENLPRPPRARAPADPACADSAAAASTHEEAAAGFGGLCREQDAVNGRVVRLGGGCSALIDGIGTAAKLDPHRLAPAGPLPAS